MAAKTAKAAHSGADNRFLFLGPELGQKDDAVSAIRKRLGEGVEETSFYAADTPAARLAEALLNASLFCAARLVIVKNAEAYKGKEVKEVLAPCLENLPEGVTAVFLSDEQKADKELENCFGKDGKKIFYEMFDERKQEWLRDFWRKAGYKIEDEAVDTLLELVENNTAALRAECGRLQLFLDRGQAVCAADVEKWLAHTRSESPFTLFQAIAQADLSRAVDVAHSLLASKENNPVGILAGLAWSFKRLRDYEGAVARGETSDFDLRRLGLGAPAARRDCQAMYRNYGAGAAGRCLSLAAEFDLLFKQYAGLGEAVLLDLFLYRIVRIRRS